MANSFAAGLILDTVSKRTNTTLGNRFASLDLFASDFSEDVMNQGQRVQVTQATAGGTTQTNATNWESGDTTLGNVGITVAQISQSFHVTPLQLNNSFRLNQCVDINLQNFANAIMDAAFAPVAGVAFTNFIEAAATFSATNLRTLWAAAAKMPEKNIILDGSYYANFLPTLLTEIGPRKGIAGFDNFSLNTRWNGAGTNVLGLVAHRNALGFISGIPVMDEETKADLNTQIVRVPISDTLSLPVAVSTWLNRATRLRWVSYDVMFGASKLDNTGCRAIKSGGTA